MLRLPFFGRKKLLLAFEYGLVIAQTAQAQGIELTPEFVKKAEVMLEGEFKSQTPTHLSVNMLPNVMSVFELDLSK